MFEAAFPLVSSCWWSERGSPGRKPEGSGMDFARAMFNFSSMGTLLECDTSEKDMNIGNTLIDDGFLMDELSEFCEFSEDNIATPARNADLSKESSRQTCETMISSSNASYQDITFETVGMLDTSVERSTDTYLPSVKDETSLEWLSSFTEDTLIYGASNFGVDSFLLNPEGVFARGPVSPGGGAACHFSDQIRKDVQAEKSAADRRDTSLSCGDLVGKFTLPMAVPGRARTKRLRTGRAAWSSPLTVLRRCLSPTNSSDSTSNALYVHKRQVLRRSTDSCGFSTQIDEIKMEADIIPEARDHCTEDISTPKRDSKKRKWKKGQDSGSLPRRCAHCLSQKTPQWRLGPTGPKTLCNACGVRFKSGRLFPEYMPAKSPTFLSHRHSNSHKKVLEMRRRQELHKTMQQGELEQLRFKLPRVDGSDHPIDSMDARAKLMSLESSEYDS